MDMNVQAELYDFILKSLCKEVGEGKRACPSPELLTAAIRDLFPGFDIPPGTGIAIHDGPNACWYVDVGTEVLPPNRIDVRQLRRELTSYIED